ncbi:MAG: hypothetical protein IJ842_06160 [Bacilli bacterium]|nr:hypothetical protein [Bacilli bacterium]
MGYRLENKDVDLSGIKPLKYVPTKKAGDVYRYKNNVLRIFRENESHIEEETARYLTNISTERILLPKKLLFYNNAFKGYTMTLVSQKGSSKKIITTPLEELLRTIEIVENDVEILSQKKVLLNNAAPNHTLYNGELYIVDPRKYSILDLNTSRELEKINYYQLQLLLTELIVTELNKNNYSQQVLRNIKELLSSRETDERISTHLNNVMNKEKNIKQYIKNRF